MRMLYIFIAFLIFASCGGHIDNSVDTSDQKNIDKLIFQKQEQSLATGIKYDTLFDGFYVGMPLTNERLLSHFNKLISEGRAYTGDDKYDFRTRIDTRSGAYEFRYGSIHLDEGWMALSSTLKNITLSNYNDIVDVYKSKYQNNYLVDSTGRDAELITYFFDGNKEVEIFFKDKVVVIIYFDITKKMEWDRKKKENMDKSTEETKSRI